MAHANISQLATHDSRRAASRLRLHLPARLILIDRNVECVLENISQTGARLVTSKPPKIGEFGRFRCDLIDQYFDTVWADGSRIGVHFDEPLSSNDLVDFRRFIDTFPDLQRRELMHQARRWVAGEKF